MATQKHAGIIAYWHLHRLRNKIFILAGYNAVIKNRLRERLLQVGMLQVPLIGVVRLAETS